ncbi:hypothetical protein ACVNS2_33520 [Paenibacillus caseinilyticus]|uniref:hypothetical protein n=1 Tax=Paenibacillus mucilaginosus TaxID=61624 RepID=UPI003B987A30
MGPLAVVVGFQVSALLRFDEGAELAVLLAELPELPVYAFPPVVEAGAAAALVIEPAHLVLEVALYRLKPVERAADVPADLVELGRLYAYSHVPLLLYRL